MNRIATNLLQEQLTLARRILDPEPGSRDVRVDEVVRLARVTIELHRRLSSGTPFPSVWLGGTLRAPGEVSRGS